MCLLRKVEKLQVRLLIAQKLQIKSILLEIKLIIQVLNAFQIKVAIDVYNEKIVQSAKMFLIIQLLISAQNV